MDVISLTSEVSTKLGQAQTAPTRDPRLPPVGTELKRTVDGKEHVVRILEKGCEWEGKQYGSLSAVAKAITGTNWNGLLFFGLTKRKETP